MPVQAQPSGPTVVFGDAHFATTGNATVISQSSANAIINWQSFSVPSGKAVQFNQPNSAAITVNRVTGTAPSVLDGALSANGQVWLLNRNGILFGQGASINVGGLLATTSDIADQDFIAGRYNFSGGVGEVTNKGTIRARKGGSVVLSAPKVSNSGLVEANAGKVVLGGTETFTVDFSGDHLLSYAVGPSQSDSVTNAGTLRAAGGKILMTARAASGIAAGVVSNSGVVEATSAHVENGEIVLDAGEGAASSSGVLDASGKQSGETGGSVTVLGRTVEIADNAIVDVSGDAGGGRIDVGGRDTAVPAGEVRVGKATIAADAIRSGNGGAVTLWSSGTTGFSGAITARGGAQGGNGGQVETSGYSLHIDPGATVNTLAARGVTGNWLLDPHNITIQTGGSAVVGNNFATTPSADTTVDPGLIATALATGNVTLQANNDILINNAFSMGGSSTNTLTLQAGRSISLANGQILSYPTGTIVLSANDPAAIAANRDAGPAFIQSGSTGFINASRLDLILNSNGLDGSSIGTSATPFRDGSSAVYIQTNGANAFTTSGGLGNPKHALGVDMGSGSLTLTSAGAQQTAPISVKNLTILLPAGSTTGNPIRLNNAANAITGTLSVAAMGGSTTDWVSFTNGQALTAGAISVVPNITGGGNNRGTVFLDALNGNLTLTGNIDTSRANLRADNGAINQTGGTIFAHTTVALGAGSIITSSFANTNLVNPGNMIEGVITSTGNGAETFVSQSGSLTILSGGTTTINAASNIAVQTSSTGGGLSLTVSGATTLKNAAGGAAITPNAITIIGTVTVPISINGIATPGGAMLLHAAGDVRQIIGVRNSISTAGGLSVVSDHGSIDLEASFLSTSGGVAVDFANVIGGTITLNAAEGDVDLFNTKTTKLGTSLAKGEFNVKECGSSSTCALHSVQDLEILPGATLTSLLSSGNGVLLAAQGNFINSSGSGAISLPNGGTWAVISGSPSGDVFNGLDSGNMALWGALVMDYDSKNVTGNRYAFITQPVLTLTANAESKSYGQDKTSGLGGLYKVSGLQPGVAGAFLADTSSIFSGAPVLSSSGAGEGAIVGGYALNIAPGTFDTSSGYIIAVQNGTLAVNPALLAIIASDQSKNYGVALDLGSSAFSTAGALYNGDTVTAVTLTSPGAATTATVAGGPYAITPSAALGTGLSNYIITYVNAATGLTVIPLPQVTNFVVASTITSIAVSPAATSLQTVTALQPVATLQSVAPTPAASTPAATPAATNSQTAAAPAANSTAATASAADTTTVATAPAAAPQLSAAAAPLSNTPLADLTTLSGSGGAAAGPVETPTASDAASDYIVATVVTDENRPAPSSPSPVSVIIPGILRAPVTLPARPVPAPGTLSAWGNAALWQ